MDVAAIASGIALAIGSIASLWGARLRIAPEIAAAIAIVAAWSLGLGMSAVGDAWREVLFDRSTARLVMLGAVGALAMQRDPAVGGRAGVAILGGVLAGSLPTALLVVPSARDPREAARLALLATAAGAISPFGGPGPQLLGDADPAYTLWALPPALIAAAISWPGGDERPARPTLAGIIAAVALIGSMALGLPNLGLQVACAFGLLALLRPAAEGALDDPGPARVWMPVRQAIAAVLLVSVAQIGGALRYVAPYVARIRELPAGEGLLVGVGWALGSLGDPNAGALFAQRVLDIGFDGPAGSARLLALGLGLAPGAALAVATATHGRSALRHGLPVALAQAAVAMGWALLAG